MYANSSNGQHKKVYRKPVFCIPGNIGIYGPSMSGKTQLLIQILNNIPQLFDRGSAVKKVVYWYGSPWQNGFDEPETDHGIVFHTGIPENMQSLFNENEKPGISILILDDLQLEMENSSAIAPLVTKGTHHSDLCTILVFQTLFSLGRQSVQVRSNLHFFQLS